MAAGNYTIRVHGVLDDTQILSRLASIQKQMGAVPIGGKGAKGVAAVGTAADGSAKKVKKLNGAMIDANKQVKRAPKVAGVYTNIGRSAKENTKHVQKFGSTTLDVTKKVVQFGAVTAVIRGVTAGMGSMVQNVFDLDSALTEFKKVSDLSGESLQKYADNAYEVGRTVAKTGVEMVEAATEFRKSGFSDKDSMELARVASMYQNVADVELSAGEAANFIVSQMKAFNMTAGDAEHIIDAVNEVSNNFAVSSADIATNIGKASAALATGNVTYEQSIGLMTGMTEITRNGAKAARGLVSIQSRYNQIVDESSSTGKKLTAWYEKHNIAIRDQNGNLRSFYEVGKDVSKIWNQLSDDERRYYLNTQAGANQSQNLAALMRNYSTAIEATETALNSEGSAAKENAKYMKSLQGHLQALKSSWSKFSNAMLKGDVLKDMLDSLTKLVDFLSTDFGSSLVKAAGYALMFGGAFKLFSGLGSLVISPITGASKALAKFSKVAPKAGGAAGEAASGMSKLFGLLFNAEAGGFTLLGTGGLIAAIGLLSVALAKYVPIGEKADKLLADKNYNESTKALKGLKKEYEGIETEINKLEGKRDSGEKLNSGEEHRLALLKEQERVLERQIELTQKRNRDDATQKARTPDLSKLEGSTLFQDARKKGKGTTTEEIAKNLKIYNELDAKMAEHQSTVMDAAKAYGKLAKSQDPNAYKEYQGSLDNVRKAFKGVEEQQKSWIEQFGSVEEMPEDIKKSYNEATKLSQAWNNLGRYSSELNFDKLTSVDWASLETQFKNLGQNIGLMYTETGKIGTINLDQFSASLSAAGYSADQVREILGRISQENPEARITIAGAEVAEEDAQAVIDYLAAVNGADADATIEINGAEYAVEDLELINGQLVDADGKSVTADVDVEANDNATPVIEKTITKGEALDSMHPHMPVDADTSNADSKLDNTKDKGKSLDGKTFKVKVDADTSGYQQKMGKLNSGGKSNNKKVNVSANTSALDNLKKAFGTIKDKAVKLGVKVKNAGAVSSLKSDIKNLPSSKTVNIYVKKHGSANIPGQASGTKNAPAGLSEVNEEGFEFIRDAKTGKLRIADGGKRTITYLNEGDIVYTHKESQKMLESEGDIVIPQHKKGKKKKQKAYDKEYKNISNAHERKMKELEYAAQRDHWSDVKLAEAKKAQLDATNKQIAALNSKYGKKITKQSAMDTLDAEFDIKKAQLEAEHDAETQAVESAINGQLGYTKDLSTVVRQINSSARLSAEEKQKYLKEAYKENVEYLQKLFDKNKKTYDEMAGTLKTYYDQGMITAKEYYDYLDDLAEKQLDKEKDRISKLNEAKENEYDLAKAYVQYQIDKLEEQNNLIEKQADLEKARTQRVKVYRQGVGFVYEQDTEAIREAEKAIDDLSDSPELKKWKDILELFGDMEALADIKELENKLGKTSGELFGGMGTDLAQWETFIRSSLATTLGYSSLLDAMDDLKGHDAIVDWLQGVGETVSDSQIQQAIDRNRFASGTLSAPAGFARVAENGYEIALLGKGDAVMPHNVSENLMQWGRYNPVEVMQGGVGGTVENFHFDSLVLPNVTDANGFMRELQNLPNKALQYSRSRG